ncbi:chromosome segregation protein SMC [SAR92 clade bacterium H455]|uniref:Chromosome partition protein Smc n=1 Tax=SAR92 clade bacterium H455 TaxID=2974818 RepID=A0ABY5TKZ3_9GAMM|nr:chromosome segregation protein SMC [SAR92 clade bacterium H455]
MRLKSIKLAGFKSFVDPTSVHFPSNLCAVVGPNGCGKSNIIDAVRWVMGESSAKNLRGESMTDVIFNGSGGRKPVGQASIELIFDNSEGRIVGEYASYSEIGIKRKVTRDGQSNYYLNGSKCRRRDITDIFLGTGLGPRSYAIIEQGMISRLIEARPEELRVYIEEAAGISKYKERRRDTENRIRRTMENLERLTDIRDELGRQLNRLERQAKAAEKYSEYKKEERQLSAELLALKWRGYNASAMEQKQVIGELEIERERIVTERIGCDTSIEKLRTQSADLNDTFNEVQGRFYKVGGDVARIEQAIEHAQQRASELHKDLEQTERNFTESEQHLNADIQKATGWQAEFDQLAPALELAREAETVSSETLQAAEESMQQWQQAWDEFNQTSAAPRQQAEVQQSRIQHLEQLMRRLSERHDNLATEASSYLASPAEEEMALIQEQLSDAEQARERIENQRIENSAQIESARGSVTQLSVELDQARSQQQSLNGRRASLEALQQAAMGDDAEKKWLDSKGLGSNPRLVDSVKPDHGWEVAAETVLGSYLQAVAVDDVVANIGLLDDFKKGELLLIGKAGQAAASGNKAKLLSDLVSGDAVQGLLGNIYAAETLAEAVALQPSLSPIESVVTREGIWLGNNWLRVARDKDATAGVLKRKQELLSIGEQKQALDKQIGELETRRQSNENKLQELEAQRQEIAGSVAQQQSTYADLRSKLSGFQVQIEQLKARKERADKELAEVHQQQLLEQENLAEARQLLQQSIEKMEADTERRETLVEQREGFREHLDTARQKARQDRDQRHDLAVREGSLSTQLSSILEGIERLTVQVARLQERRTQLREAFDIKDDPSDKYQLELEEKLELRLTIEGELNTARTEMEEVDHEMRKQEKQRMEREEQLQEVSGRLETQRIAAQEITTLSRTIEEQIVEKSGDLEVLLENLAEDAEMVDWEEQLQLIGNRINRLGPINLAAIDEYKIESERKDYLDTQNAELEEAMETLKTAIQKIDRETRTRFKETFELVNKNIQELFPKLFGGGHAYLELTGDDLLDTGVTLMARPPGKKNASIQLLSGGEKALTAIAMVFAIFRLNPAPFCMLDEVDAPLDDANVGRYAAMVKEMSDQVQFIFITHNKISMEAANQLMGVTMHEPGVSRLVSVDVNQAAELADA